MTFGTKMVAGGRLKITEKEFSNMTFSRGVNSKGIGEIRAKGDGALFGGKSTEGMKEKFGVSSKKPLADYLPNVTLKAKDLAVAMKIEKTRQDTMSTIKYFLLSYVTQKNS